MNPIYRENVHSELGGEHELDKAMKVIIDIS